MELATRFLGIPAGSCLLLGPRGTGKSTWLTHMLPDALRIDLLKPDVYRELAARPERLSALAEATPPGSTVIVDEVQRVPELLNVVHGLIESPARRRFVLTGSSARKLRRGGVDLLAGRATLRTMHPFMAGEWPGFDLDSALRLGLVPLVRAAADPEDTLRAYATLYLEREVQAEGWARNVGAFARFLEAISFSHAHVLNLANVARECQVERKTAAGYLGVLEDLLLSFRLPVFTTRAARATVAHPKFYLFDTGIFRALRPSGPLDRDAGFVEGDALEGLVAQHLRAWLAYSAHKAERTTGAHPATSKSISSSTARRASGPSKSRTPGASVQKTCARSGHFAATIPRPPHTSSIVALTAWSSTAFAVCPSSSSCAPCTPATRLNADPRCRPGVHRPTHRAARVLTLAEHARSTAGLIQGFARGCPGVACHYNRWQAARVQRRSSSVQPMARTTWVPRRKS